MGSAVHHPLPPSRKPSALSGDVLRFRNRDPENKYLRFFPGFLVLGPQRTGTNWIYQNLKRHPQVFLPGIKETYFFSTLGRPDHRRYFFEYTDDFLRDVMRDTTKSWLRKNYEAIQKYNEPYRVAIRGEATAENALITVSQIREILAIQPNLKAIMMLRDPIERAWARARNDIVRLYGRERLGEIAPEQFAHFFGDARPEQDAATCSKLIGKWANALRPGNLFVGDFSMIQTAPAALLTSLHEFLGIRSGTRYSGRHLEDRIGKPAAARKDSIPESVLGYLNELFYDECRDYRFVDEALNSLSIPQASIAQHRAESKRPPRDLGLDRVVTPLRSRETVLA